MVEIISKIIPIILLLFAGYFINQRNILKQSTINEMKKIVINGSLPAVLFLTFINMELKKEYFLVSAAVFLLLIIFCLVGVMLNKVKAIAHPLNPFIVSGFSFGLLGISLYGTVFGMENLGKISILGIGHELFIWVVYFTALKMKFKNEKFSLDVVKGFFKSPFIIGIVLGVILNVLGLKIWFHQNALLKGIYVTLQYLSNIATPLILIIVGFDFKLNKAYMKQSVKFIILRMASILICGYIFKYFVINLIITPDALFNHGYFTFLILPLPFSFSIFVGEYSTKEHEELANNTVVLNTGVSIIIYIIYIFLYVR